MQTPVNANEALISSFEDRLIAVLLAAGAISTESVERALRARAHSGGRLVDILLRLGLCKEMALAVAVAEVTGLEICSENNFPDAPIGENRLSVPFLREARILPLTENEDRVVLAAADPADPETSRALTLALGKPVTFVVAAASMVEDGLMSLYGGATASGSVAETMATDASDIAEADLARLRESASHAPVVRFVERLLARAIDTRASDIHVEPLERRLRVRLRIDGILHDEETAPLSSAPAIVSRIKILSRLDIGERRLPQDGALKLNVRGREVDLRVATAPVANGETVAIRIFDREAARFDLGALGFDDALLGCLAKALQRPNGIVLVTGPTGSGKSTTLYAALNRLNTTGRKIITVEDPVEYKLDGLNQIQVKPGIGLDFARALRSILRHDPDVIMVGEIRDAETARIAIQAALTGHLVLSTLHTNDAASAVVRLHDMGIEDYLLTSTITGVIAQRLVRSLCVACRRPAEIPGFLEARAAGRRAQGLAVSYFETGGCELCRGTGYIGRTVVAEFLEMDSAVRSNVLAGVEAAALRNAAIRSGMPTLYESGLDAVFVGITSHDEVLRVAQDLHD